MIVEPKIRNNVCLTAHPTGCARQVEDQIEYVRKRGVMRSATGLPTRALIIGSSNGYGLASRIVAGYGYGAATVGVAFERPGSTDQGRDKLGTAGWYNDQAFLKRAAGEGLGAWSLNGDAFSPEVKEQAFDLVRRHMKAVDLLIYSIASPAGPRHRHPPLIRDQADRKAVRVPQPRLSDRRGIGNARRAGGLPAGNR